MSTSDYPTKLVIFVYQCFINIFLFRSSSIVVCHLFMKKNMLFIVCSFFMIAVATAIVIAQPSHFCTCRFQPQFEIQLVTQLIAGVVSSMHFGEATYSFDQLIIWNQSYQFDTKTARKLYHVLKSQQLTSLLNENGQIALVEVDVK